ncbi:MAG TPA: PfkB family carbohydrate kinase [Candidatus Limnocylindrales bacterium]|nr:PfkB family carbohydrate kinase [Candidatus Limnocylindrales bacterium]
MPVERPRVVVGGEALIDLIIDQSGRVTPAPGGGQYNTARTIARLGGDAHFLGRLSDDWFGRLLRARLEADGVGTDLVVETADPTTLVLAEIDAAGGAHYHWYIERTTVPGLQLEDARRSLRPSPAALHVGTLGLTMEPVADSLAAVVAEVPAETLVMVDPNCRPTATPDVTVYRERMSRVLGRADIVKGSDEDFAFLALAETPEASARLLLDRGVGAVIVTHGSEAARAWCAGGEVVVPVPVVEVVDTVGAGDTFGGAFLARWLEQGLGREQLADRDRLEDAVAFAARAAAINCTRAGAEPPTRQEMGLS